MRVAELHGQELVMFDQVVQELVELKALEANLNWAMGDLLIPIRGYTRKAAAAAGHNPRRLQLCAEIAAKFPVEERNRDVPWAFFAAVKDYPLPEALELLERAEVEDLNLTAFGRLLRSEPEPETHECPECHKPHKVLEAHG